MSATPKKLREAQIYLRGHAAVIHGVPPNVLNQILAVTFVAAAEDGGVIRLTREKVTLYTALPEMGRNVFAFPAGFVKRVEAELTMRGYQVTVADKSRWLLLEEANRTNTPPSSPDSARKRWIEIFCTLPRAQVVVRSRSNIAELIGMCASIHEKSRILVVSKNNDEAMFLEERLRELIPGRVQRLTSQTRWVDHIVLVASSYHAVGMGNQQFHVVIYVGHETPVSQIGWLEAAKLHSQPRYCVRYPWKRPPRPFQELQLESVCGPVEYTEPEKTARPRHVWFIRCDGPPSRSQSTVIGKPRGTVRNRRRNALIVSAVKAVQARDQQQLQQLGMTATAAKDLVARLPQYVDVAVLVHSVAHAQILHKHLPGARLARNGDQEYHDGCRLCTGDTLVLIVTEELARTVPPLVDVLLRASGGTAPLTVAQGRPGECDEIELVVDVWDAADPRSSERRVAQYREHGAIVTLPAPHVGTNPVTSDGAMG